MRRLWRYRFRRTTLLLLCCLAFLAGVATARSGHLMLGWWFSLGQLPLIWLYRQRYIWTMACLLILFGGGGWQRGSAYMVKLQAYQSWYGHKVTLQVRASDDAAYGKNSQLSFDATQIVVDEGHRLAGKVQISGFHDKEQAVVFLTKLVERN